MSRRAHRVYRIVIQTSACRLPSNVLRRCYNADRRQCRAHRARILGGVRNQRQVVDYALRRRALLAQFQSGLVNALDVCDAQPYLLQAAKFHGRASHTPCPVCRAAKLTHVSWVYGDELKQAAGSARAPEELERMANLFAEFNVFVVEVCRACGWNHLIQSYVLGTGTPPPHPKKTAGQ